MLDRRLEEGCLHAKRGRKQGSSSTTSSLPADTPPDDVPVRIQTSCALTMMTGTGAEGICLVKRTTKFELLVDGRWRSIWVSSERAKGQRVRPSPDLALRPGLSSPALPHHPRPNPSRPSPPFPSSLIMDVDPSPSSFLTSAKASAPTPELSALVDKISSAWKNK